MKRGEDGIQRQSQSHKSQGSIFPVDLLYLSVGGGNEAWVSLRVG